MNRIRWLLGLVLLGLGLSTAYYAVTHLAEPGGARAVARPLPRGDQELAYIQAATSGASWQRFVEGIRHLQQSRPELGLEIDDRNANLERTTDVPEVGVRPAGRRHWLRVRWYKLTSDLGNRQWVEALAARRPPPLAVIGGGSSDRARDLALALQTLEHPDPPLLAITTATADTVQLEGRQDSEGRPVTLDLMKIHPDRSFRFCFTNRQMARAVIDLVWQRPYLTPQGDPPAADMVTWLDDPYSIDLSERLADELRPHQAVLSRYFVPFSVGDFQLPNSEETGPIRQIVQDLKLRGGRRSILALPTVDKPARRFIRAVAGAAPVEARSLTVVTGDSINFNTVFRDRAAAWNVLELPVSLVFFCHANPLNREVRTSGSDEDYLRYQAQDDLMLNASIMERLIAAAYPSGEDLITTPGRLASRLREVRLSDDLGPFFDGSGNRREGSGEYVVCLLPRFDSAAPSAVIEIWSWLAVDADSDRRKWKRVDAITVGYTPGDIGHAGE